MLKLLGKTELLQFFKYKMSANASTSTGTMSSAIVYSREGAERLSISFSFSFSPILGPSAKEQDFNFDRLKNEELEKTLYRIKENLTKGLHKKMKKKKKKTESETDQEALVPEFSVKLYHRKTNGEPSTSNSVTLVSTLLPNSEAWIEGAVLEISDAKYAVVMNPPTVNTLALPKVIMAGFPVFLKIEGRFLDLDKSDFVWYVEKEMPNAKETTESEQSVKKAKKKDSSREAESLDWEERSVGHFYVPRNTDIGSYLKLVCTPRNESKQGSPVTAYSSNEVQAGPGVCPFENRQQHTSTYASDGRYLIDTLTTCKWSFNIT